ncbi:MAG: hypothetical protein J6M44_05920, partial [Butyrivibrio sp.]|nr:hypothetical protein [Butyrivibrio sp.]
DAEDKVTEAEKKDFDAGKVLSDAETASANAKTALDNITKQNNTYETELGYAEQELERAETALSAAEDDVKNNQSAQEQALAKLDDHIGKQIKELREEVISMNEDDPDFQNKVNELGKLIAENLFLDEDEKEAYEKGEFTFEYSVNEDKDVIIRKVTKFEVEVEKVIPGSPEGFYSEDGELFKENHYSYYVYNENEVYAANSSEPAYTQDNNPVSGSATDDGEPWDVYEEIPGTTLIRGTSELRTVDGHDQYYVKETTKKCYNVTTYKKVVAYDQAVEIVDAARGQAETEADNIIENLLKDNSGFIEASREFVDYEIPPTEAGGMIKWGCKTIVTLKSKEPDVKEIAVLEETYEAKMFAYRAEVEPQYTTEKVTDTKSEFVAFSDTGAPRAYENDYVEKKAIAEDAVSKAQAATTAYEDALSKVSAAREKVEALKNAGAPVSQEKIEQAANAHTAALANLETAQSAKRASQEKLKEARQALETAQQKINDIKERDRIAAEQAQQASNEEGADGGSDEGTNGGSDDNGSGNGGSGSNGSDNGNGDNGGNGDVIPGAGHQITGGGNTTINPASGAEVISLVTNPAGNPATQYRSRRAQMSSLAQSLTNEILGDNSGSVTDIAAASNTDKAKELAQAAGTTAQSAVASAFNTTLNKSAVQIGDNDVALASTPSLVDAETSDKKTPLMLMLLGIAAAGVAGASAELITRRRDR